MVSGLTGSGDGLKKNWKPIWRDRQSFIRLPLFAALYSETLSTFTSDFYFFFNSDFKLIPV